jgi:Xaa-Pro dipeptidase
MCRSFVVGGNPTAQQRQAHRRIEECFEIIEKMIEPGIPCRSVYEQAIQMLHGFEGWSFDHHLGHGIGLNHHERPRINPGWDDTFKTGDVFTLEPGLYGTGLRAGLRLEEIYHLSASGLSKLTTFPRKLI